MSMSHRFRITTAVAFALAGVSSTGWAQSQPVRGDSSRLAITTYGEVRTRSEWDRPLAATSTDFFTLMRSRLGVRIVPSSSAKIVMEMQDSRVLGDATSSARQSFDLHQGYLELTTPLAGRALQIRAGRQEIALANERLVGAVGWSNFGRAFDGLRLSMTSKNATTWTADLFGATLEERGRHFGPDRAAPTQDHTLGGVYLTRALNKAGTARAELTGLLDVGSGYRVFHDARRSTVDLRLRHASLHGLRFELEGALQSGRQHVVIDSVHNPQDVGAWLAGVRIGNAATSSSPLAIVIGADVLSGDNAARDGRYSAFSTLYGTNHPFYGLIDLVGDPAATTRERGLQDVFAQADIRFTDKLRVHTEVHHMQLATGSNRSLGWEADAVLPLQISDLARIDLGYSAFRAGTGAADVGLGTAGRFQHWAYVQLRASFQR
jgi:hypothetical protein